MADDSDKPATDFLDQAEIDRLLTQKAEAQSTKQLLIRSDGTRGAPDTGLKVRPHDFRKPALLSEAELSRLSLLHEEFVRYLSARLSLQLRMEFGLKLAALTTVAFSKFTEALTNPTHLCLFKVEPLAGVGILDINPRLALTIADRLLGGRGQAVKAERHLTEIEIALVEDVIVIVLEEWCAQWKSEETLRPLLIGHESNGRFLQTSTKDAMVLAMTLEASLGDCAEQIQICLPYHTIEPLVKKMEVRRQKDAAVTLTKKRASWQTSYDRISVPLRAEWQAFDLSLRELCSLSVGDVIEMQPAIFNETRVLLNGMPTFVGTVGLDTDRVAVQLTRKLPLEEGLHINKSDGRKDT